jgi:uncharacterized membrane protein YebE (DUF533 family)
MQNKIKIAALVAVVVVGMVVYKAWYDKKKKNVVDDRDDNDLN